MSTKDITEQLVDVVRSAIKPLHFTPPVLPSFGNIKGDEEQVCLLISDVHLGEETPKYNFRIARKRLGMLVDKTMEIVSLHRKAYPVKVLNIFWLGDLITGETIFPTQPHHIEAGVVDQIFKTVPFVVEQLARLACFFKEVRCYCVAGNHGRVGKFAHESSNWDRVFYKTLELSTQGVPNIKWVIPEGWNLTAKVLNTKILCVHGHQVKMWQNIPAYGLTTRVARWAITEGLGSFDVVFCGHFHTSWRLSWNNIKVFLNGTTADGDEFALEKLGLESSQSQWLLSVHPRQGITWSYELNFNRR